MIYTYDQQAWICNEFGPCPRCSGISLHDRLPGFINVLNKTMQKHRDGTRLWWKPWELSNGQLMEIIDRIDPKGFGMIINPSTSNEVYPFNDRSFGSDLGVKRVVQVCNERKIPVIGEFDHTFYKPLYILQDYFPRLIYEQMMGWKDLGGLAGIKEYYGFSPETFSVNADMLRSWIHSPEAPLEQLLNEIVEPYGEAAAPDMLRAWELVSRAVESFPWDTTYGIGQMGLDHHRADGKHPWVNAEIVSMMWQTPIWQVNRRGNFMLLDESKAHPWIWEDVGLRLNGTANLALKAVDAFDKALEVGSPRAEEIKMQRDNIADLARATRARGLHFLYTIACQSARTVSTNEEQFKKVCSKIESYLLQDLKNQGGAHDVQWRLDLFREDPRKFLKHHFPVQDFATTTTIDWEAWDSDQE
jgi:hypothetical protein